VILAFALVLGFSITALGEASSPVRVGLFTDLHAHEVDSPGEKKVMTNYAERLNAFVGEMNRWEADLVIQLGDLINGQYVQLAPYVEMDRFPFILEDVVTLLGGFAGPTYHVIGNHDVYSLSKQAFLEKTGDASTYYSFDAGGFHIVVLDAQYTKEGVDLDHAFWVIYGTVPEAQLTWLQEDLAATDLPTIVCIHQPLDVESSTLTGENPIITNNAEVRAVLEGSGVVVAVFQGHEHENRHNVIDGIHYVTFQAMVDHTEPTIPAWATITLDDDQRVITIDGHGDQASLVLPY
jgi:alkaline phosphatase